MYFLILEAVENNKYGWFWECPAGGKSCKYKHALPKDFVLKKDRVKKEKEKEGISIEDLIETERGALDQSKLTKVTLQTFVAWKKKKLKEKALAEKKEKDKKKKDFKESGGGGMSGRDMFLMDPSMMERHVEEPDDDEGEFDLNTREGDVDDGVKVNLFSQKWYLLQCVFRCMKLNLTLTESWMMALMTQQMFN